MKCKYCNSDIEDGAKFCPSCGKSVDGPRINNGLAVASLVLGIISLIGGFATIIIPIIGLVLGLSHKEKCSEKTLGVTLNAVGLVLGLLVGGLLVGAVSIFGKFINSTDFDNLRDRFIFGSREEYQYLYGSWVSKTNSNKTIAFGIDNEFEYTNGSVITGIYTAERLSESGLDTSLIEEVKSKVDGIIDKEKMYYVKLVPSKSRNEIIELIFIKIEDESEYFVYDIGSKTSDYYIEGDIEEFE